MVFFYKQKTAYEMRISDWSSDVCSSDLGFRRRLGGVLDEVEEDLEQRIAVDEHRRQRGIEAFVDRHIAREPRARDAAGMVEQRIDILRGRSADRLVVPVFVITFISSFSPYL